MVERVVQFVQMMMAKNYNHDERTIYNDCFLAEIFAPAAGRPKLSRKFRLLIYQFHSCWRGVILTLIRRQHVGKVESIVGGPRLGYYKQSTM